MVVVLKNPNFTIIFAAVFKTRGEVAQLVRASDS